MTPLRGLHETTGHPDAASDANRTRVGAAVVICASAADRWDDLRRAVTSVRYQTIEAAEIVVVIDHNDPLLERARRAFPHAVVVPNAGTAGLAGARNTGIAASTAPVVVFLDDGAVAERTWLDTLLAPYDDPSVIATGGEIVASWEGERPAWFPRELDWVVGCSHRGLPRRAAPVRTVIGGNMSFRRRVFDEVGTFRADLGATELCVRALRRFHHGRVVYEPGAVVHHRVPAVRTTRAYFLSRCRAEGAAKARLYERVGGRHALSIARSSALRSLPSGLLKGLWDGVHLDRGGPARAGAIVSGLASAARGYLVARTRRNEEAQP